MAKDVEACMFSVSRCQGLGFKTTQGILFAVACKVIGFGLLSLG